MSCLTDPLSEIFCSQVRTTETCHDKAEDTGNISIMKKRQAVELDNQKLSLGHDDCCRSSLSGN